jgi:phospholipid N-methyltransferase
MEFFTFIKQSISHPGFVGAVMPSSRYTAIKMVDDAAFYNARYVVELGPGTGAFTNEILKKRKPGAKVLSIEYDEKFCSVLRKKFGSEKDFHIIHGSAEDIDKYVNEYEIPHVDYIVSALPFLSLPKDMSKTVLRKSSDMLANGGKFVTIAYTKLQYGFIGSYFNKIDIIRELRNVPPAYIFSCSKA